MGTLSKRQFTITEEDTNIIAPKVNKGSIDWRVYEGCPLCIEDFDSAENVPTNALIDDLKIAKLIDCDKTIGWYNQRWPVDFDKKAM